MLVVIEEWLKSKGNETSSTKTQKKKFLKQVKVLRDEQKTDAATGDKLASGLGFAEFEDEQLALFAIRYLNNMELTSSKGLISDYSLEDARALFKREKRFERLKKVNEEKKKELKKQKKADGPTSVLPSVVDLGKKSKGEKEDKISIDKIEDQELLHRMLRETISRGKRQRIKKRLAFLRGDPVAKKEPEQAIT